MEISNVVRIHIRIPEEVKEAVSEAAEQESRSLNAHIVHVLKSSIQQGIPGAGRKPKTGTSTQGAAENEGVTKQGD